jgi:hypothetical protein
MSGTINFILAQQVFVIEGETLRRCALPVPFPHPHPLVPPPSSSLLSLSRFHSILLPLRSQAPQPTNYLYNRQRHQADDRERVTLVPYLKSLFVITVLSFFQLVSKAVSGIQFLQVGGDRQLSFDVLGKK